MGLVGSAENENVAALAHRETMQTYVYLRRALIYEDTINLRAHNVLYDMHGLDLCRDPPIPRRGQRLHKRDLTVHTACNEFVSLISGLLSLTSLARLYFCNC